MKLKVIVALMLGLFAAESFGAQPSGHICTVKGRFEGPPTHTNTHGVFFTDFVARDRQEDVAKATAGQLCRNSSAESCAEPTCRQVYTMSPRPIGTDTEISCADENGIQVEIKLGRPGYVRVALIGRDNALLAAVPVAAFTPSNEAKPTDYEGDSGGYSVQLSVLNTHLFLSGPGIQEDDHVLCLYPAPPAPLPSNPHHCQYCGGGHH